MPFVGKEVVINGKAYMDGGISSSIPIERAIKDGYDYNIVILTRNKGYRKKPSKMTKKISNVKYRNFKGLTKAISDRYKNYNREVELVEKLEKEGKVFVIRPTNPVNVGRIEKDKKKIFEIYKSGYIDTVRQYNKLKKWLDSIDN